MLDSEMDVHLPAAGGCCGLSAADCPAAAFAEPAEWPQQEAGARRFGQGDTRTPRDRDGTFEPQLIEKHQRRVPGFDEKILALYAKGMTTRDIQEIVRELYGVEVSATLVSAITADLDAEVTAWRTRPLSAVWPIVYFDGITVHVRGANGRVSQHTIYVALGVNLAGKKELLGLWLGENRGPSSGSPVSPTSRTAASATSSWPASTGFRASRKRFAPPTLRRACSCASCTWCARRCVM